MQARVSALLAAITIVVAMIGAAVPDAPLAFVAARGRGSHAGQRGHRQTTKHTGHCMTRKRRRTAHVVPAQPAHRRNPKRCKIASRHPPRRSASLAPITAMPPAEALLPQPPPSPTGTVSTGCFSKLVGGEACGGYPDAGDTGVPVGTGLTKVTGQLIITKEGEVVSNKLIEGGVVIRANNVHLEDDEVVAYTQSKCGEKSGGAAITVLGEPGTEKPVTGVVIKHDTIRGVKATCPEALQAGIWVRVGSAATVTAEYNKLYWLGRCFQSAARWENNYCLLNATLYGEHYEDVFEDGTNTTGAGGVIIKHNTLLNFHEQTAVITLFAHSDVGEEIVENNFMAGGGYVMYLNGRPNAGVTVKGPVRVRGNRVARCTGETEVLTGPNEGVHICKGTKPELQEFPGSTIEGYGESGFFPLGGSFGMYYPEYSPLTFSGNYWDNNLQEIPSP